MDGWMIMARVAGVGELASSSTNIRWCASVDALIRTTGAFASSERAMSVTGAAPVMARLTPGTKVRIVEPGLKPSFRLYGVGLTCAPALFFMRETVVRLSRLPVSGVPSATVKKSFGKGYMHALGSRKSHGQPFRSHGQVQSFWQVPLPPQEEPGGSHCSPTSTCELPQTGTVVVVLDVVVVVVLVVDVVVVL